jgi:hypothetical protein
VKVRCDSYRATKTICQGCGGSVPHDDDSCEQCPVDPFAKCVPVMHTIVIREIYGSVKR